MTAEISVMNKLAVAMAADSAMTVVGKKVYNTGSKLFPISHELSIGFMFYGNAEFISVPWETILATYREGLGGRRFDSVSECGHNFLEFMSQSRDLFPEALQKRVFLEFLRTILGEQVGWINQRVQQQIITNGSITEAEVSNIIDEKIAIETNTWGQAPFVDGVTAETLKAAQSRHQPELLAMVSEVFQKLPIAQQSKENLVQLSAMFALKALVFNGLKSGVVFCGFGDKEKYPHLFSVEMDMMLDNRLKRLNPNESAISEDNPAEIRPFAQNDVALSFLKGMDPIFSGIISEFAGNFVNGLVGGVTDKLKVAGVSIPDIDALLIQIKGNAVSEVTAELERVSVNNFVAPVINAVRALSKDDLAHMAETLVSLTSFRRKMSLDLETVGGPVDVAVISKKDGFIWVKRKHYFEAEMNPHYFSRKRKGVLDER